MKLFNKFRKKDNTDTNNTTRTAGMEDFMSLIRVYYQAVMAARLGINNLAALPDLRIFKQTLHVPTVGNKLGVGEKNRCKKMLSEIYGLSDNFFKEIDHSVARGCKNINNVQPYFYTFQGFSQELMMLMGNLIKWKFRIPSFMRNALRTMIQKTVHDILTRDNWKKPEQIKSCLAIRNYQSRLGYSEAWMSEYVYHIIILAKKEPKPRDAAQ